MYLKYYWKDNILEKNVSLFWSKCLLFKKQFGYRARHSTDHAEFELIDELGEVFSNQDYILGIFIDLSKAFDTVDHEIMK